MTADNQPYVKPVLSAEYVANPKCERIKRGVATDCRQATDKAGYWCLSCKRLGIVGRIHGMRQQGQIDAITEVNLLGHPELNDGGGADG